jgi:hypothetical protein
MDYKYLKRIEMWCWRRMEEIIWTDRVKSEEVLPEANEKRNVLHTIKRRSLTGLVTSCVGKIFYKTLLKEIWKRREDEEEDISSCLTTLRRSLDTGI